jgi:hypothetical protein
LPVTCLRSWQALAFKPQTGQRGQSCGASLKSPCAALKPRFGVLQAGNSAARLAGLECASCSHSLLLTSDVHRAKSKAPPLHETNPQGWDPKAFLRNQGAATRLLRMRQSARQRPRNPLPRYLRITGATVCLLISFFRQYAESNQSASPLAPLLVLQRPQHRAMFHSFGCLRESSSICSQLARLLRLRAPILNLSLQYTQDLSLRSTCLTTRSGMRYFVPFLRTRDETPHLFVIDTSG